MLGPDSSDLEHLACHEKNSVIYFLSTQYYKGVSKGNTNKIV